MNTALLASLENAIGEWISDQAENDGLPTDAYYPEDLSVLMARAAAAVFDVNRSGQIFAKEQEPSK